MAAAECGAKRQREHRCPSDCPHNPFAPANYSRYLEIEETVDRAMVEHLYADSAGDKDWRRDIDNELGDRSGDTRHAFIIWNLFFRRSGDGLTCAERWERNGFEGLNNDQGIILRARLQMRMALIEIHRVLNSERVEAVDLLEPAPAPIVLQDRCLAQSAARFAVCLVWIVPLPHYWRVHGTALKWPDWSVWDPVEILMEQARHLGAPPDVPSLRRWLTEYHNRFATALTATAYARQRQVFAQVDSDYGKALYRLTAPFQECREVLDSDPRVEEGGPLSAEEQREGFAESRTWLTDQPGVKVSLPENVRPTLGRILLGAQQWRVEAMTMDRFKRLRAEFEQVLGTRTHFVMEERDNLASRLIPSIPDFDPALVPPHLVKDTERMVVSCSRVTVSEASPQADLKSNLAVLQYRDYADTPIPALDNHTPRQAATDPPLRPTLIRLMKSMIRRHDEENLRCGSAADINWLVKELGLNEILFEPPPRRTPVEKDDDPMDLLLDSLETPSYTETPPAPPLPAEPFAITEAGQRLVSMYEEFGSPEAAFENLDNNGTALLDHVADSLEGILTDDEIDLLEPRLLQVWYAMVPPGYHGPLIDLEALEKNFLAELGHLVDIIRTGQERHELFDILQRCRQPAMARLLGSVLMKEVPELSKTNSSYRITSLLPMLTMLVTVIDELDQSLRK
jgi:hypothetical protein